VEGPASTKSVNADVISDAYLVLRIRMIDMTTIRFEVPRQWLAKGRPSQSHFEFLRRLASEFSRATSAARHYDELSRTDPAQLTRQRLTPQEVPRRIFESFYAGTRRHDRTLALRRTSGGANREVVRVPDSLTEAGLST
jgi:hypothetical protein